MARMTWDTVERPILESIADLEPGNRQLNNEDIAVSTGLDRETIDRGLLGLLESVPPYVTGTSAAAEELCYLIGVRLTERGRRAVGVWPARTPATRSSSSSRRGSRLPQVQKNDRDSSGYSTRRKASAEQLSGN
jgi:hypothetical protein